MRLLPFMLWLITGCTSGPGLKKEIADHKIIINDTGRMDTMVNKVKPVVPPFNHVVKEIPYKNVPVNLLKGDHFTLKIPYSYNLSIAAEGLKRLRFLALSPDGRLFATDMYDKSDNRNGRVLIFEDWNDTTKLFRRVVTYIDGLHNPNQAAFYKNYIYIAETDRLIRYEYLPGENIPQGKPQVITIFPDYGLGYKYGGWHLTRSIAFHNDKLYVSVGSSCNACIEKEEIRASIIEMDPDGTGKQLFARGLRNSVGLKWIGDQLWATGMGRDLMGPEKPEDVFQEINRNQFYGWPYYFQYHNQIFEDMEFKDSTHPSWSKKPPVAFCGFKAHSAPLGFDYFKNFKDELLANSVLVCLHGSTSVWRQRGNAIVKVGKGNSYVEIVTGFLNGKTEADRHGRPCDILMKDTNAFFFTDDFNGVLYYVWM